MSAGVARAATVILTVAAVLTAGCSQTAPADGSAVAADADGTEPNAPAATGNGPRVRFPAALTPCTPDQRRARPGARGKQAAPSAPPATEPPEIGAEPRTHRFCADVPLPGHGQTVRVGVLSGTADRPLTAASVLVYHPGGPGIDPVDSLFNDPPPVDLAEFTVLTWRGVTAGSDRGACGPQTLRFGHDRDVLADAAAATVARECGLTGDLAGATRAADELVGVLEVLGLGPVSLLAHSYGTAIAQQVLSRHPDRVRRAVLDGPVGLQVPWAQRRAATARTLTAAAARLLATCVDVLCGVRVDSYAALRGQIIQRRATVGSSSLTLSGTDLDQATLVALRDPDNWAGWRTAVRRAADGDGSDLYRMSEQYWTGVSRAAYYRAVCRDLDLPGATSAYRDADPLVAAYLSEFAPCAHAPSGPDDPPREVLPEQPPEVLVVASPNDVLTPTAFWSADPWLRSSSELCETRVEGHTSLRAARPRTAADIFLRGTASAAEAAARCATPDG